MLWGKMEQEVIINYETLFEMLRREKNREELQKLPENFLQEVQKYINEKRQTTFSKTNDPFSEVEQEKTQRQLSNIKKILREVYERREKKIIAMALNKSRIPNSAIETSVLLTEEKELFDQLVELFNRARNEILLNYLSDAVREKPEQEQKTEEKKASSVPESEESDEENEAPQARNGFQQAYSLKTVRFLCDTSQFVGPNLEIYGPFCKEETANLPSEVCTVLINRNKAEFCDSEQ